MNGDWWRARLLYEARLFEFDSLFFLNGGVL